MASKKIGLHFRKPVVKYLLSGIVLIVLITALIVGIKLLQSPKEVGKSEASSGNYYRAFKHHYKTTLCVLEDKKELYRGKKYDSLANCQTAIGVDPSTNHRWGTCNPAGKKSSYMWECRGTNQSKEEGGSGDGSTWVAEKYIFDAQVSSDCPAKWQRPNPVETHEYESERLCRSAIGAVDKNEGNCNPYGTYTSYKWFCKNL